LRVTSVEQSCQTVSGQEVCEEDDDSNGAYNLMER